MRKLLITFCTLIIYTYIVNAQTNISGEINSDITLILSNSPYIVTGDILINTGVTLTIEAGVVIKFNSQTKIQNKGTFIAIGEPGNKIVFTSNELAPAPGDWTMIEFSDETIDAVFDASGNYVSGSILQYAKVLYGGYGTSFNFNSEGAVMINGAIVFIDNVDVKNSLSQGIYLKGGSLSGSYTKISNCNITNCGRMGIRGYYYKMGITVDNCRFEDLPTGRGMYLYNSDNVTITNNIITNTDEDYTIYIRGDNATIKHNIIIDNASGGISFDGENSVISYNKIINSKGMLLSYHSAIHVKECDTIKNNIIVNCTAGLRIESYNKNHIVKNNQFLENDIYDSWYFTPVLLLNQDAGTYSDVLFKNNLVLNNTLGSSTDGLIYIEEQHYITNMCGTLLINGNNFLDNDGTYVIKDDRRNCNVDASDNWWNTTSTDKIDSLIFDSNDDPEKGIVDYTHILTQYDTAAPVMPPINVTKDYIDGGVALAWDKNPEPDIAGYKIYWGDYNGYSFTNSITTGNISTYQLMGVSISDTIAITSYDSTMVGINDQCEGNESWFSIADYLNPCTPVTGTDTRTECNSYTWIDGNTYTSGNNTAIYNIVGGSVNGCDSVVTLDLTINYSNTGTDVITACDSYTWIDGNTYTSSNNTAIYTLTNENGCDSIISINLRINPLYNLTETKSICSGSSYIFPDGTTQNNITSQVIHVSNLQTVIGCDSIIETTLNVNPIYDLSETVLINSGDSYAFPDGTVQNNITSQVIYTSNLQTVLGCDSIIETTVNVDCNPVFNLSETDAVCISESYIFPDGTTQNNITSQVIHVSNLQTVYGCDSIIQTTVNINPRYNLSETVLIKSGGSYTFPDGTIQNNITSQIIYTSKLQTVFGCDSIIETTVNVDQGQECRFTETVEVCYGSDYVFPDGTLQSNITSQVVHESIIPSSIACDTIIETTVNVNQGDVTYLNETICEGETFQLDYAILSSPGLYGVTLTNQYGCDSLVNLDLTVIELDVDLGRDKTIDINDTIILDAGENFESYSWSTEETSQKILIDSSYGVGSHIFNVMVTDENDCTETDNITITISDVTDISFNDELEGDIKLYPNPTSGKINIDLTEINEPIEIRIFDITGKTFLYKELNSNESSFVVEIPGDSGVYFIKLSSDLKSKTYKVIKE